MDEAPTEDYKALYHQEKAAREDAEKKLRFLSQKADKLQHDLETAKVAVENLREQVTKFIRSIPKE